MVCLGNICRSPLAQGAMEFLAKKNSLKFFVDSAGTEAWHTGKSPDHRAQKVAIAKSWDIASQKARKITPKDFRYFDLILAMDRKNLQDLQDSCSKDLKVTIKLLLDFSLDKGKEVPDPYFSGNFEYVSNLIEKACLGFIESNKSVL